MNTQLSLFPPEYVSTTPPPGTALLDMIGTDEGHTLTCTWHHVRNKTAEQRLVQKVKGMLTNWTLANCIDALSRWIQHTTVGNGYAFQLIYNLRVTIDDDENPVRLDIWHYNLSGVRDRHLCTLTEPTATP